MMQTIHRDFVRAAVVAIAMMLAVAAVAQEAYTDVPEMPGGIDGERIQALIDFINAGDPELVPSFFAEHATSEFFEMAPLEMHRDVYMEFVGETGGVDFHSIRIYDPPREGQTIVILKDRTYGAWKGFALHFTDDDERRIAGLRFTNARTPSDVEEPALSEAECMAEIAAFVEGLCDRDLLSGSVLVARGRDILYDRACGEASKRFHVANNMDTRFNLGSMNKMFTATAVMQLVERGELTLDEPISAYVDGSWLPREITDRVTIHHLLSHTSGLGSYFNDTYDMSARKRFRVVDDFKPLVRGDTLAFEPGEQFQYSNTGMLLLGVVIESVTGGSYFDYIRENIYGPAGMTRTDCYEMDTPADNLAMGYYRDADSEWGWRNNLYEHVIKGGPAGGGFSTAPDLHRFAVALVSGELVGPESLEQMWVAQSEVPYGYGFSIDVSTAGKVVGHGGGFIGINSNLDIFPESGYISVVLANYDGAAAPVDMRIRELLGRIPRE